MQIGSWKWKCTSRRWGEWMGNVLEQPRPHPGKLGCFGTKLRISMQRSLILNTLLTLQSVDSIWRVKIRVFGVADGFNDDFRRGEGEAAFAHICRDRTGTWQDPKVRLLPSGRAYSFGNKDSALTSPVQREIRYSDLDESPYYSKTPLPRSISW